MSIDPACSRLEGKLEYKHLAGMLEGKSLAVGVVVVVVAAVVEVEGVVVVGSKWEHTMVDKLASEEGEEEALRVVGSSSGHRLGRTFACMVEDREVGVGVAQVAGEVWRDPVRSGDVVPSALGLEDECMGEDTSVESLALVLLHCHCHFRFPLHFRIPQLHLGNHTR